MSLSKPVLFFILILFIAISGYISGMFYVIVHEQAHVAVFTKYGIDSTSVLDPKFISGYTAPNIDQYNLKCNDICKSDQLNIDAIGYHSALLIFSVYLLVLSMISFYIFFIYNHSQVVYLKPKGLYNPDS